MARNFEVKRSDFVSVNFLDEIFARFRVPDTIVSDNAAQFTSREFGKLCKFYFVEHITTPAYHPRSNGQVEKFVDSFNRRLKKINGEQNEVVSVQQFLRIYRMTSNPNTQSELMFGWRIRSIYDKLLPGRKINVWKNTKQTSNGYFKLGDKFFSGCIFQVKKCGKIRLIISRLRKITNMIHDIDWRHKRHVSQFKHKFTKEENVQTHLPIEIL